MKKNLILLTLFIGIYQLSVGQLQQCTTNWPTKVPPPDNTDYTPISTTIIAAPIINPKYKPGWHLILDDEFNGFNGTGNLNGLNTNYWTPQYGVGAAGTGGAFFVDPVNIQISNGRCILNCHATSPQPKLEKENWPGGDSALVNYTGSYIKSKYAFGSGYYWEMKGKRNDFGFKSSWWMFDFETNSPPTTKGNHSDDISIFDNGYDNASFLRIDLAEQILRNSADTKNIGDYIWNIGIDTSLPLPNTPGSDYTYGVDWQKSNVRMYMNNQVMVNTIDSIPQGNLNLNFWSLSTAWNQSVEGAGGNGNPPNLPHSALNSTFELDYVRQYKKNYEVNLNTIANFNKGSGWTDQNTYPRFFADINGDGKQDIIGFGSGNIQASLSNNVKDISFSTNIGWLGDYTTSQGYTDQNTRPRIMADINGDGKADIVGFGNTSTYASLSNSTTSPSFLTHVIAVANDLTVGQGWADQNTAPRMMADVTGDGKADIVCFGYGNMRVYPSTCTTSVSFGSPWYLGHFTNQQGYVDQNTTPRMLADVNGDGIKDLVGFNPTCGVEVSLGTGTNSPFSNATPTLVIADFTTAQGWTNQNTYPRFMADVNGDKMDDIIGFGNGGVYVSLSTSSGNAVSFQHTLTWVATNFTTAQGYNDMLNYPRYVCDINNDNKADIVGFIDDMIQISISESNNTTPAFDHPTNFINDFTKCMGWSDNNVYPRCFTDVNGDGSLDLIGFGYGAVVSSENVGGVYNMPFTVTSSNKQKADNWSSFNPTTSNGKDVAYQFYTPDCSLDPTTTYINVSITTTANYNAIIQIFDSTHTSVGSCVTGTNSTLNVTHLMPNRHYYVVVDGVGGATGNFTLTLNGTVNTTSTSNPLPWREMEVQTIEATNTTSNQVNVYPNPNNGNFTVETSETSNQLLEVFDLTGRLVLSQTITGKADINASSLTNGIYNIKISGNNNVVNKRIVVSK